MPSEYKMLWYYMLSKCDHAGIWRPNKKTFEGIAELKVNLESALEFFNSGKERIWVTAKKNWWIIDFFVFQYGFTFNINNNVHKSIYSIYNQQDIDLTSLRGLKEVRAGTWRGLPEDWARLKEKDKDSLGIKEKFKQTQNGKNENYQQFRSAASQGADVYARLTNRKDAAEDSDR